MKTKIYVLQDKKEGIRYIGKTKHSLQKRFSDHLYGARCKGAISHKVNWIRSLLRKGQLPKICLIEEVEGDGNKEERTWIAYFRAEGIDLVNETDGGDGGRGRVLSQEVRLKIGASQKGRPKNSDSVKRMIQTRWTMEKRQKARELKLNNPVEMDRMRKLALRVNKRKWTDAQREKMSEIKRNDPRNKKHMKKLALLNKGNSFAWKGGATNSG